MRIKNKKIILILIVIKVWHLYAENEIISIGETLDKIKEIQESIIKHEKEFPVFVQKSGLIRTFTHSFYIRSNDEWTGFTTLYVGYRYGVSRGFNIAIEYGVSLIPQVYLANILFHFTLFETKNRFFYLGLRTRFGYKYMEVDLTDAEWLGQDYLKVFRSGFHFEADLTAAFRFGKYKDIGVYYTIYPRFDFDLYDKAQPIMVLFSPIMTGFEFRFGKKKRWNFAIEGGMTIPLPYNSIELEKWVNFPSLGNFTFSYTFGDKFYKDKSIIRQKRNLKKN